MFSLTLDRLRSAILYSGDVYATSPFFTITSVAERLQCLQTVSENDTIPPVPYEFRHTNLVSTRSAESGSMDSTGDDDLTGRAAFYGIRFSIIQLIARLNLNRRGLLAAFSRKRQHPTVSNVKILIARLWILRRSRC